MVSVALGVPLERDRIALEIDWKVLAGSTRFPPQHPGIKHVQHTGSRPKEVDSTSNLWFFRSANTLAKVTPRPRFIADAIATDCVGGFLPRREALRGIALLPALLFGAAEASVACAEKDAVGKRANVVLNFADYGACDGVTNDAAGFALALSLLRIAGGGVLRLPPKSIAITLTAWCTFSVPANVTIIGTERETQIHLSTNGPASAARSFVTTTGDNVTFDGVKLVRHSDFPLVFFVPGGHHGLRFIRCVVDGQRDTNQMNYAHGIGLDASGAKSQIVLADSTWTRLDFTLFQSNPTTQSVNDIVVDNCTFRSNYADDLCFNAPNSNMSSVLITHCRFHDNKSAVATHGFGVSFAHVTGAMVRDCYFENYYNEGIHLEDYSTGVVITGNQLVSCGTGLGGGITVQTGCSDTTISKNRLDARANTFSGHGVTILAAGSGATPGGRPIIAPSRVTVSNNIFLCGSHYRGIYVENASDSIIQGNLIFGAGVVRTGVWDDANPGEGMNAYGTNTVVDANTVRGFRYGIWGSSSSENGLDDRGSVTGNMVFDCYLGITITSGALDVHGNGISNCVRPMVVGEGTPTAPPCSVIGNYAIGCVYEFEIDGKLILIRPGNYPGVVGLDRIIDVTNNILELPVGTVITFEGGGAFTLTAAVSVIQPTGEYPYTLTGDISGADINSDDVGTATNLPHSTTSANNHSITS